MVVCVRVFYYWFLTTPMGSVCVCVYFGFLMKPIGSVYGFLMKRIGSVCFIMGFL